LIDRRLLVLLDLLVARWLILKANIPDGDFIDLLLLLLVTLVFLEHFDFVAIGRQICILALTPADRASMPA